MTREKEKKKKGKKEVVSCVENQALRKYGIV